MSAKVEPESRTCPVCGSGFLVGGTGNKKRTTVFCGVLCRNAAKYNTNGAVARDMSSTEAAYLAGIIDGEGHVSIYGGYGKTDPHAYRGRVEVTNTSRSLMDWIVATTQVASVTVQRRETATRKECFIWPPSGEAARSVLVQVLPYLVIKADRARLVIDFQERLRDPAQKADKTWQHAVVAEIRGLNARGPKGE